MNKIPVRKYHCRKNQIEICGNIAYIITKNLPPETIIIDKEDISKIENYSWSAHPYFNNKIIKHRWRDTSGKWHSLNLASVLGYGHGWKHKNGNVYDFRKENMAKNDFYNYRNK